MPNDIPVYDTAASRRVHDWQPGQLLAFNKSVVHERSDSPEDNHG
jgi:hypothetical protein